jgi:hypothetical protein
MAKTKPPVDVTALDGLLVRVRAAVAQLITDGEVDERHLRRIFRMLESTVIEAEETVEDIQASSASLEEYRRTGGIPFDTSAKDPQPDLRVRS